MTQDAHLRTNGEPELDIDLIRRKVLSVESQSVDASSALLRLDDANSSGLEAQVARATAIGMELIVQRPVQPDTLLPGSRVDIEISDEERPSHFKGSIVSVRSLTADRLLVAVRIHEKALPPDSHEERRREMRWHCSSQYFPTGVAGNPAKYNDFIYFRVQDVSRGGVRLITSMRNKFLARDMTLDCIVSFPMISQVTLKLRVGNVSITSDEGKDYLSVGAEMLDLTDEKFQVIAQYLAQFGDAEVLRALKAERALPTTIGDSLEFTFVRSAEEYREVLELRCIAYSAEGKVPPQTTAQEMSDVYDSRSRIVACKLRGQIVASARLTFHEANDLMEHEEFVAWSSDFPRRDESVEVTRACTHPDYRGSRLFFPLLGFIVITALQARRNWVVTSSTSELVDLYERIGMLRIPGNYTNPMLNNSKHFLLIGSVRDAILGRSVGPIVWNLVWRGAATYATSTLEFPVDPVSRVRLSLYRAMAPLVPLVRMVQTYIGYRKRRR